MADEATARRVAELTRLALAASARDDSEGAIGFLREATGLDADASACHYLLGAEYAQIGLVDRAIEEMELAVAADPALDTARFQIGLLHLTAARVDAARAAWEPLAAKPGSALALFAEGLLATARDDFAAARSLITRGLESDCGNPALERDMRMVLAEVERAASGPPPEGDHVLISAYKSR